MLKWVHARSDQVLPIPWDGTVMERLRKSTTITLPMLDIISVCQVQGTINRTYTSIFLVLLSPIDLFLVYPTLAIAVAVISMANKRHPQQCGKQST